MTRNRNIHKNKHVNYYVQIKGFFYKAIYIVKDKERLPKTCTKHIYTDYSNVCYIVSFNFM